MEFFKTKYERFRKISAKVLLEDLVSLCSNFEKKSSYEYKLKCSKEQLYNYEFTIYYGKKSLVSLWKSSDDIESCHILLCRIPIHWIFTTEAQLEKILLTEDCPEVYDAIKDIQANIEAGVLKMIRTYYTNPELMSDSDFLKMDNLYKE